MDTKPELPKRMPPKRSCIFTVVFPIENDATALEIKNKFDDAIKDIPDKRYNFQITEG
jgi:hypothetical protein